MRRIKRWNLFFEKRWCRHFDSLSTLFFGTSRDVSQHESHQKCICMEKKSTLNATRWQHGQNFNDTLSKKVALEVLLVYWFSWSACMECPMWPADAHSMNQNHARRHIKGYKIKSYEWKQFFLVRGGRRIHNHGFVNGFRRKSHSIRSFSPRLWRNFIVYYIVCVYPDDVYVSSNEIKKGEKPKKKN